MSAPQCPYHTSTTAATVRLTYTYGASQTTVVDNLCDRHIDMHIASLKTAASVTPVSRERIEK